MIKREILAKLEEHLSSDQITVITGPRQVGKTYLMRLLKEKLDKMGRKTVWLNLDYEEDASKFASQTTFLSYLELQVGGKKAYVFIDEIQRKENVGLFLKGIFDMGLPYKFIISGSGSLELRAKIPESMAGRKQMFIVDPVSFEEFVNWKTEYKYEDKLQDFFKIEKNQTERLLGEYMMFGGYPRVVIAKTNDQKQREMQEIYRSYIDRDILNLLHLEKTEAFTSLLKMMASQIGSLVNISELSNTIGLDQKTIKNYLWYLEQTFVLKKVTPFYRNTRKEITKTPIYYFLDTGIRNWLLGLFGLPELPMSLSGHLFENIVFNILRTDVELTPKQIHYWRTKDSAEVDFVLEEGLEVTPIEAKYTRIPKPEFTRSFKRFLAAYHPKGGLVIHLGDSFEAESEGAKVNFIPWYEILRD